VYGCEWEVECQQGVGLDKRMGKNCMCVVYVCIHTIPYSPIEFPYLHIIGMTLCMGTRAALGEPIRLVGKRYS